jgi:uncharacterized protein YbcI
MSGMEIDSATRPASAHGERGALLTEVSNALTRLHKQYIGKGPTQVRAHFAGPNMLILLLEGGYTRAEQSLMEGGHDEAVDEGRARLQSVLQRDLVAAVEGLLGREVRSFMSANDTENGYQVEVFVLAGGEHAPAPDLSTSAGEATRQAREVRDEHRALRAEQVQSRAALRRTLDSRRQPPGDA